MPGQLEGQAREFAKETSALLNATVTSGVRISALTMPKNGTSLMGRSVTRTRLKPEPIPLARNADSARTWLFLFHAYALDDEGVWLAMTKSTYAVYSSPEMDDETLILSVDFSRESRNAYPGAHLHVSGARDDLGRVCDGAERRETQLRHLHFPVGGRRYRPCLEDVLEFVILEGMADGHDGWDAAIAKHRSVWYERQLAAAVRRSQDVAAQALSATGWTVTPPER